MAKAKNAQAGMLTEDKFLTVAEQDKLLDFWEREAALAREKGRTREVKTYLAVSFLLRSGLRASEAVNVQVKDFRAENGVPAHLVVRKGKGDKSRKVYIGAKLKGDLKTMLAGRDPESFIIAGRGPEGDKKSVLRQALGYVWRIALEKAGVRHVKLHGSRHSFGHRVYRDTGDIRLVQKQLGHSSIVVTQIYADLSAEDISERMKDL